jgi:hypothetical protein
MIVSKALIVCLALDALSPSELLKIQVPIASIADSQPARVVLVPNLLQFHLWREDIDEHVSSANRDYSRSQFGFFAENIFGRILDHKDMADRAHHSVFVSFDFTDEVFARIFFKQASMDDVNFFTRV